MKNDLAKKTMYDKLVAKVNNIDVSGFFLENKYDTDKKNLEKKISDTNKKIPDTNSLVKKQIPMLKLTKQRVEYLILPVLLQILH